VRPPRIISTQLVSAGYYAFQSSLFELRLDTLLTSLARHSLKGDGGCHAIVSPYGSISPYGHAADHAGPWIPSSGGKHASFRTRAPGILEAGVEKLGSRQVIDIADKMV